MNYSFKMKCHAKPQTPCTTILSKPPHKHKISYISQSKSSFKTQILALSLSSSSQNTEENVIETSAYNVEFKTMGGCKLGISRYPNFEYNAEGGFGSGSGIDKDDSNEEILVKFDVNKLYIPSLTSGTTKFLCLPLPPFLKIDIVPEILQGSIHKVSGKVDLAFKAKFWFSVGAIYKAPPLLVTTILTSEDSEGQLRKGRGQRMNKDGKCQLVGIATVNPIDDIFMNTFLSLPTECLAVLNATISLQ